MTASRTHAAHAFNRSHKNALPNVQRISSLHLSDSVMDPAVLIFLLYVMIAHDLVCGLIQYRAQATKPHKRAALTWRSSARICHGPWRVSSKSVRSDRLRWKKTCRIVRKA